MCLIIRMRWLPTFLYPGSAETFAQHRPDRRHPRPRHQPHWAASMTYWDLPDGRTNDRFACCHIRLHLTRQRRGNKLVRRQRHQHSVCLCVIGPGISSGGLRPWKITLSSLFFPGLWLSAFPVQSRRPQCASAASFLASNSAACNTVVRLWAAPILPASIRSTVFFFVLREEACQTAPLHTGVDSRSFSSATPCCCSRYCGISGEVIKCGPAYYTIALTPSQETFINQRQFCQTTRRQTRPAKGPIQ